MKSEIIISALAHTWVLDLDGTIVKHNGYLLDGKDSLLPGAKEFIAAIPDNDMIVFLTSRKIEYKEITEQMLLENGIHWDHIIYEVPYGERILINDDKPSGLSMAKAIRLGRDKGEYPEITIDPLI